MSGQTTARYVVHLGTTGPNTPARYQAWMYLDQMCAKVA